MKKEKKTDFRIVLKKDWWYYVQKRYLFFIWVDMRPFYDCCLSLCKSQCKKWIEMVKNKEKIKKKNIVVWYY